MGKASRSKKGRAAAGQAVAPTGPFWHGGVPGLRVGGVLLPGGGGALKTQSARGTAPKQVATSVFFTSDQDLAYAYAQTLRHLTPTGPRSGALYEVVPLGPVAIDPDYAGLTPAFSFTTPRARITKVVADPATAMTPAEIGRAFGQYQYWAPGEPFLEADGTPRPGPSLRAEGWTPEAFALLPKWVQQDHLWAELTKVVQADPARVVSLAPEVAAPKNVAAIAKYLGPAAAHALQSAPAPTVVPTTAGGRGRSLWDRLRGARRS
ncbi:hypothetical protein ACRQ4C_05805 [Curtobacterium sp. SP.BCp]|uniref:hypothetical protein n=1 Tax=Curtobacterium sp. SP.BCp TaxID=3435230 RepID=UPI003F73C524